MFKDTVRDSSFYINVKKKKLHILTNKTFRAKYGVKRFNKKEK